MEHGRHLGRATMTAVDDKRHAARPQVSGKPLAGTILECVVQNGRRRLVRVEPVFRSRAGRERTRHLEAFTSQAGGKLKPDQHTVFGQEDAGTSWALFIMDVTSRPSG